MHYFLFPQSLMVIINWCKSIKCWSSMIAMTWWLEMMCDVVRIGCCYYVSTSWRLCCPGSAQLVQSELTPQPFHSGEISLGFLWDFYRISLAQLVQSELTPQPFHSAGEIEMKIWWILWKISFMLSSLMSTVFMMPKVRENFKDQCINYISSNNAV